MVKIAALIIIVAAAVALWLFFGNEIASRESLETTLQGLGAWSAVAIVSLRALAAVMAVVPSSPVLLAAGATEGILWGTIYVLIGAQAGAVAAFLVGRWLGRDYVERRGWMEPLAKSRYGKWLLEGDSSQTRLMAAVFYCRLLPGLNLDGLSYVAGVTPIALWRFALATFGALVPYTVLLVAIGQQLVSMDATQILIVVSLFIVAGAVTLVVLRLRGAGDGPAQS